MNPEVIKRIFRKSTDKFVAEVDKSLLAKEKEIMEV